MTTVANGAARQAAFSPGRTLGHSQSERSLERARRSLAGGDSSSMRVLPYHLPLVAERGEGARLYDAEGRSYIDCSAAHGWAALGHSHPEVTAAIQEQAARLVMLTESSSNDARARWFEKLVAIPFNIRPVGVLASVPAPHSPEVVQVNVITLGWLLLLTGLAIVPEPPVRLFQ